MADMRSLDDYVDVAVRIADFRAKHPRGTLRVLDENHPYRIETVTGTDKTGEQTTQTFIVYVAVADDGEGRRGIGMAWEIFPGRTPYTRGSELMNAETSAWGRAIIAVGASDSKQGIASREEVRNRQAERDGDDWRPPAEPRTRKATRERRTAAEDSEWTTGPAGDDVPGTITDQQLTAIGDYWVSLGIPADDRRPLIMSALDLTQIARTRDLSKAQGEILIAYLRNLETSTEGGA